ncbi:MAG: hypothetical protein ACI8UO_002269 [Verrucomicrobiales bacterium]|jgi:hypothetical protein
MRWLLLVILGISVVPGCFAADPKGDLLDELEAGFRERLADFGGYEQMVRREASVFPEGDLFPYTLVSNAFSHRAIEEPEMAKERLPFAEVCLRKAVESVAGQLGVKPNELSQLDGLRNEGTYVGQLALALALYEKAGGTDQQLLAIRKRLTTILRKFLDEGDGQPIPSYPGVTWPFDTAPALAAISMDSDASELIKKHRDWLKLHAQDRKTGLPFSEKSANGKWRAPRGCDLSWRLALWSQFDPKQGQIWYDAYTEKFWLNAILIEGFREWTFGQNGAGDLDSGPILLGVGSTASVLGLMTTAAYGDEDRRAVLMKKTEMMVRVRREKTKEAAMLVMLCDSALIGYGIQPSPRYLSGFLFGDVTLFYSLSWRPIPPRD